jgi:hypothetical protein
VNRSCHVSFSPSDGQAADTCTGCVCVCAARAHHLRHTSCSPCDISALVSFGCFSYRGQQGGMPAGLMLSLFDAACPDLPHSQRAWAVEAIALSCTYRRRVAWRGCDRDCDRECVCASGTAAAYFDARLLVALFTRLQHPAPVRRWLAVAGSKRKSFGCVGCVCVSRESDDSQAAADMSVQLVWSCHHPTWRGVSGSHVAGCLMQWLQLAGIDSHCTDITG